MTKPILKENNQSHSKSTLIDGVGTQVPAS